MSLDNNLRRTTIGIRGLRWKQLEDEFTIRRIIVPLIGLTDLDIDYFSIVPIVENHPENSLAISVPKAFLERVRESLINEKEMEESSFGNPLPELLSPEMLEVLPGISMPEIEEDVVASSISDILLHLWRLSETRQRLSKEESTEVNWFLEMEKHCKQELAKLLTTLRNEDSEALSNKYQRISAEVIENEIPFTPDFFQQLFAEDIQSRVMKDIV